MSRVPPPSYPHGSIQSLAALSRTLGVPADKLLQIAKDADNSYRLAKPIVKADGSVRRPVDARVKLKGVQVRIKERILDQVRFPDYLTGSLKGKDAVANARLHVGASVVVCEDVAGFFPATSSPAVLGIWRGFFGFSTEVSELLTQLTTLNGALPEGAVTSSHLANLAFWREEHALYEELHREGIRYSRYVDDVSVSSVNQLSRQELAACISRVYTMMGRNGYRPKRAKQQIQWANGPVLVTKLQTNTRVALTKKERHAIRGAVHGLERMALAGPSDELLRRLSSVSGQVARLRRLHPNEGQMLKSRLDALRRLLTAAV
ncbi:RNA-directed DNA polymerase [Stenotrophomonas maltophilia]|uniref:Reverse transcriptase family protein n=1 Tax=Stenotrophomonas riyadhensis TaxID=2859893 RepID=A0ABT2XG16_9GAMM|nr:MULTISPECIES: reverse transcriptase family protein [unclassified Stenotrophomonas]MBH1620303.1 RNA-directed DNA polymerase [Stenotrophomonas maltophilia]MCV0324385.1 reverse transcriptase family protein [Stenotrophomonas sp. CFS3442]MDR6692585.1 hypothetical protein [Stenotrophomonas sp. 1337]HDS1308682.1 RNA-directed DNA polymerase [Stenotrophomonas maltophilia]HDS1314032.1 RNA-directed DNA polymerase [Stenotrophomonas maltophilia]